MCDTAPTAPWSAATVFLHPSKQDVKEDLRAGLGCTTEKREATMKTIFDPSFRYTSSFNTDLKRTFAKIRRVQREESVKAAPAPQSSVGNVSSITRRKVGP